MRSGRKLRGRLLGAEAEGGDADPGAGRCRSRKSWHGRLDAEEFGRADAEGRREPASLGHGCGIAGR